MVCPTCQGPVFDNRQKKAAGQYKPNAPDFACQDKACGWKQWPPKEAKPVYPPHPAAEVEPVLRAHDAAQVLPGSRDDDLVALYWDSFDKVLAGLKERKLSDLFNGKDIAAMSATMVIMRSKG